MMFPNSIRLITANYWKDLKTLIEKYRETFAMDELEMLDLTVSV